MGREARIGGRVGARGQDIALNAIYYRALSLMGRVAPSTPTNAMIQPTTWQMTAAKVKLSANILLFNSNTGPIQRQHNDCRR